MIFGNGLELPFQSIGDDDCCFIICVAGGYVILGVNLMNKFLVNLFFDEMNDLPVVVGESVSSVGDHLKSLKIFISTFVVLHLQLLQLNEFVSFLVRISKCLL